MVLPAPGGGGGGGGGGLPPCRARPPPRSQAAGVVMGRAQGGYPPGVRVARPRGGRSPHGCGSAQPEGQREGAARMQEIQATTGEGGPERANYTKPNQTKSPFFFFFGHVSSYHHSPNSAIKTSALLHLGSSLWDCPGFAAPARLFATLKVGPRRGFQSLWFLVPFSLHFKIWGSRRQAVVGAPRTSQTGLV